MRSVRATVDRLKMNHPDMVFARQLLAALGMANRSRQLQRGLILRLSRSLKPPDGGCLRYIAASREWPYWAQALVLS